MASEAAAEAEASKDIAKRGARNLRHGSMNDFMQLVKQADSDFRERARSEIDLCSSPTLRVNSDEVMVVGQQSGEQGKGKTKVNDTQNSRSLQPVALFNDDGSISPTPGAGNGGTEPGDSDGYENDGYESEGSNADGYENENEESDGEKEKDTHGDVDEDEHGGEAED